MSKPKTGLIVGYEGNVQVDTEEVFRIMDANREAFLEEQKRNRRKRKS